MSTYLGFEPTKRPNYYFISYNSEDSSLVSSIVKELYHRNVPLWYDYGIEYGKKWEEQISVKIKECQAVLLFFTKGILQKDHSYVKREYEIAQYLDKKIYVVLLEKIEKEDVPINKLSWWLDINENQCIDLRSVFNEASEKIMDAIGISDNTQVMNSLIKQYKELYEQGDVEKAEAFLNEYLHNKTMQDKMDVFAHIVLTNTCAFCNNSKEDFKEIFDKPLIRNPHSESPTIYKKGTDYSYGCLKYGSFIMGIKLVFHRGNRGDATIVDVWREDELMYTFGGLIEANVVGAYYDKMDDILFVYVHSDYEGANEDDIKPFFTVLAIEKPYSEALCTKATWLDGVKTN